MTNIVPRRIELHCSLDEGHAGLHRDAENDEEWETIEGRPSTVVRHEDEKP